WMEKIKRYRKRIRSRTLLSVLRLIHPFEYQAKIHPAHRVSTEGNTLPQIFEDCIKKWLPAPKNERVLKPPRKGKERAANAINFLRKNRGTLICPSHSIKEQ
ncbi:MAG: hypothetical protein ACE5LV_08810, partial [Candidatus Aminicenantales bacterium]